MSLREYFEQGRKQEQEYERKQQLKRIVRKPQKPAWWSPVKVLIGAGVFYQIIHPKVKRIALYLSPLYDKLLRPTAEVIRADIHILNQRIRGINPDWEAYNSFYKLAKGKR